MEVGVVDHPLEHVAANAFGAPAPSSFSIQSFTTGSDTEVVLEAWRHWGTSALARFRGMFAFAVHDADQTFYTRSGQFSRDAHGRMVTPAGLVLYWLTSNVFSAFQQYFTVGLGLLGGDIKKFTGRDLQPRWATLPGSSSGAPIAALTDDTGNGRVDSNTNHKQVRTPGSGSGATGAVRRPRPGQSKGRKRGKR